jgi:hypothetical protein
MVVENIGASSAGPPGAEAAELNAPAGVSKDRIPNPALRFGPSSGKSCVRTVELQRVSSYTFDC